MHEIHANSMLTKSVVEEEKKGNLDPIHHSIYKTWRQGQRVPSLENWDVAIQSYNRNSQIYADGLFQVYSGDLKEEQVEELFSGLLYHPPGLLRRFLSSFLSPALPPYLVL